MPIGPKAEGLRVLGWPRWPKEGAAERVSLLASCGSRTQLGDSEQVVGSGNQLGMHLNSFPAAVAGFTQAPDGLHPAERFLHLLANALADRVAGMARGAAIDGRASRPRFILRDMRS